MCNAHLFRFRETLLKTKMSNECKHEEESCVAWMIDPCCGTSIGWVWECDACRMKTEIRIPWVKNKLGRDNEK